MWVCDAGSFFTVARAWDMQAAGSPARVLDKKIAEVKRDLCTWNRAHYGIIQDWICPLTSALDQIQQLDPTQANMDLESSLKGVIHEQLTQEHLLWKQRSRVEWLVQKDLNTKFFHMSTVIHCNRNSINLSSCI